MASAERIFQALDWHEQVTEPAEPARLPARVQGKLEFRHLTFGYDSERARPARCLISPLHRAKSWRWWARPVPGRARSSDCSAGSTTSRTSRSFWTASTSIRYGRGRALACGRGAAGLPHFLRHHSRQHPPGQSCDQPGDAIRAAKMVHADSFIESLPGGYDEPLVERGQNLSQGQRQLLAFARVLAADPEILILDEATASIDTETEQTHPGCPAGHHGGSDLDPDRAPAADHSGSRPHPRA